MIDSFDFPTKRDELAYHGRNALGLPLAAGVAAIRSLDDARSVRRLYAEFRVMQQATELMQDDTPEAVRQRDEVQSKIAIWSLELNARIAELYDALPSDTGNHYGDKQTLTAVNVCSDKAQFLDEVGIDKSSISKYRKLATHRERLPAIAEKVKEEGTGAITQNAVLRAIRAEDGMPEDVRLRSSESNEWYTPAQYVDAARLVMGGIDCDPASHAAANEIVRAGVYYTLDQDGLSQPWHGRVWLNPPYNTGAQKGQVRQWVMKLRTELEESRVSAACVLVSVLHLRYAELQALMKDFGVSLTLTDHYIKFISSAGTSDKAAPQSSALLVFGRNPLDVSPMKSFGITINL